MSVHPSLRKRLEATRSLTLIQSSTQHALLEDLQQLLSQAILDYQNTHSEDRPKLNWPHIWLDEAATQVRVNSALLTLEIPQTDDLPIPLVYDHTQVI